MRWDWSLDLTVPPVLLRLGVGVHGVAAPVEHWRLDDAWSLHCYRYRGVLRLDGGEERAIRPGMVGLTPPGMLYEHRFGGRSVHCYVHFRAAPGRQRIGALLDLGSAAERFDRDLQTAIAAYPRWPQRAAVRLHDLLWQLAEHRERRDGTRHPALVEAERHIELNLAEPIGIAELAEGIGISHNQLTRLFRTAHGCTVIAYLRERRLQRARDLLQDGGMTVATVAAAVGIPDLQHFNKLVRRRFARPPRAMQG